MKISESKLREIVYNTIKESLETAMAYTRGGNGNSFDDGGRAAMAAMGEYGKEMQDIAMRDKGEGYFSPYDEEGEYYEQKPADWERMGFKKVMEEEFIEPEDMPAIEGEESEIDDEGFIKEPQCNTTGKLRRINESQLRKIIYNTIKEAISSC